MPCEIGLDSLGLNRDAIAMPATLQILWAKYPPQIFIEGRLATQNDVVLEKLVLGKTTQIPSLQPMTARREVGETGITTPEPH